METGRASRTAEHNALFRALEATRPATERLVDDPLASAFLCRRYRAVVRAAAVCPIRAGITGVIDRRWPGVRTAVVARTRLIDDTVAELVESTQQMVVLGAGFDTRAWRLSCIQGARVVEVDHPDTQRDKQAALGRAAGVRPGVGASVRFVPTDFDTADMARCTPKPQYWSTVPLFSFSLPPDFPSNN